MNDHAPQVLRYLTEAGFLERKIDDLLKYSYYRAQQTGRDGKTKQCVALAFFFI